MARYSKYTSVDGQNLSQEIDQTAKSGFLPAEVGY
jgi:hypothetical protein